MMSTYTLSIGDLVARTGVAEPTLRMWERRHGFPQPQRTASGHRRYSEEQAAQVFQVVAARQLGLSLSAAIERALRQPDRRRLSLYAALRRSQPGLEPRLLRKVALLALSHAIEDESMARAERQILFASFQRERFYRQSQERWRQLARGADAAAVFADFGSPLAATDGPAEIPISATDPLAREWALVVYGERSTICLAGREPASSNADAPSGERSFEVVWTVDPEVVRAVSQSCTEMAAEVIPEVVEPAVKLLAQGVISTPADQLELTAAVVNRALSYIS